MAVLRSHANPRYQTRVITTYAQRGMSGAMEVGGKMCGAQASIQKDSGAVPGDPRANRAREGQTDV